MLGLMDLQETMSELEAMGTEQNRRVYRRHGAGDRLYGVSFTNLKKLAKLIKVDQGLAEGLWQTGNGDARNLAALIADPKQMSSPQLSSWLADVDYYVVVDSFVRQLASRSEHPQNLAREWMESEEDFVGQAGWELLALLAMENDSLSQDYLKERLRVIEASTHKAANRTRYSMNSALTTIGLRNDELRLLAEQAAGRIGKVVVDHGETGCKTPDARAYIEKSWARRSA